MKKLHACFILCCLATAATVAQETGQNYGIRFSGFVKNDIFYDTRQSSASNGLREGHFYLFPDNKRTDADGVDINANPSFHILSIQTRIKGDITGPDAFGAKTSGLIEAEFFGTSEADINGFRLRHAWIKFDWKTTSLLIGQNWHPLFPVESFPGTISFNTGAPFTPFSRNPQVKITQKAGLLTFSATAYSQRDFISQGPDGASNKYLRNSGIPGLNAGLKIAGGELLTGWAGVDYKVLRPELRTETNYETDSKIGSVSVYATLRLKTKPVNITVMGIRAQNATDLMMTGGYAVKEITDVVRRTKEYTNLCTGSLWADISTNGSKIAFGLFSGYSKNMGSKNTILNINSIYGRGTDIDHIFRLAPRITFTSGKISLAFELENTLAAYGTTDDHGKVSVNSKVTNTRLLLATIYRF